MRTIKTPAIMLLLLGSLCFLISFIPKGDDPVDKLVTALKQWTDTIPQEKVYLQMDKPYYALGDTIWFKGYVTVGSRHQLSALSGALYVELVTEKDSIIRSLKLPITSGMVMGDITLGDEFREGSYRLRAYTQWMRNAGEEYFFDRTFTVGNVVSNNIIAQADYRYKDVDGKPVLTATLNYSNDDGKPLAARSVYYQIFINKKVVWATSVKTDANGNIPVRIANDAKVDLAGAYIHTTLDGSDKYPIIRDFPIKAALSQSDVQFFPESGNLVNGVLSHVAFKAVGIDGLGVAITGKITDNDNKEVADLETLHAGMGSFLLRPEAGKTYTASISFADGTTKTIALPIAVTDAYVLSVYQPNKDSVLVRINTTNNIVATSPTLSFVAQTRGETVFASAIKISKVSTSIWLDKKAFPGGIAQFTLFNDAGEPLNERVAFIRGDDHLNLKIATAKTSYTSKERVQVDLKATDSKFKPVPGNFSVSVIDESKVPFEEANESTIFSNLLLTSDLKGYVEKPNYYFINESEETNRALDNLMLTQGYRRFAWKEIVSTSVTKPAFEAEGLGFKVSGKVTTLGSKLVPGASVMLMSVKAGVTKVTTTDANGRFKFDGIFLTDSVKFAVQARTAKNSDKVKVILDTIPKIHLNKNPNLGDVSTNITATLKAYIDNTKKEDDIYEKFGQLDRVHRLREVRIHAKKIEEPIYANQGMYRIPQGHSDQEIIMKDVDNAATLSTYLTSVLKAAIFKPVGMIPLYPFLFDPQVMGYVPAQIILDGRKIDGDEAAGVFDNTTIDITDIVKIDVVRTNMALKAMLNNGVALMIYTRRGMVRHFYTPSLVNINPKGFNKAREFYSPKYDRPGNATAMPDLRTTVYWNPYLKTDASGKTTFNFFNADGPGTYKVTIEGINAAGELGRAVYRYTVDEGQASISPPVNFNVDKNLAMITAPLDSLNKRLPVEKVYLHTDKPYYNIGDTLWFKSYLVDGVNLTGSRMSGLLYVELDNDSSEMVRRISIPIKNGLGWGQIPLPPNIFHEGGYTLRAYTNWMQNFGEDMVFSQRFYLGVPAADAWLVRSNATINHVADKDQLNVSLFLNRPDKLASPVALRKVEVKIYENRHYLYKQELQTGLDGSLVFSNPLKEKIDVKRLRVQVTSLEKADNNKVVQVPLNISRNLNIDLQFLPESGNLVAGLRSVIGFKAIGEDGKGTPVAGSIYDSKGNAVATFAAIHNGMGSVELTLKAGETYSARLEQPLGVIKGYALPAVSAMGTVMHISNPENGDELKITLCAGGNINTTDSACYLVGTSRGVVYYSQKVDMGQPEFGVSKKLFPSGIARFTLFKGKRPLNQRAVFIDNHDQLSIRVTPNKADYAKRDSVDLEIEVKDKSGMPVQGSFSLAVTDDSQVKPDSLGNYGIAASLFINSELKGHIEAPGYYLNRKEKQAWEALDNLMLTQGWTGYDWKDVFDKSKPVKFAAEKDFKVTGQVTGLTKKPVPFSEVLISSQKPTFQTTVKTDSNGRYIFNKLPIIDSGSFFIQASNAKGKKLMFGNVSVDKFRAPAVPETMDDQVLPWYVNTDSTQINYVKRKAEKADDANLKLKGIQLKQVEIKGKKIIPGSFNRNGPGKADLAFDEQDIKESAVLNLYELMKQKLPGIRVINERGLPTLKLNQFLVVIDIDGGGLPIQLNVPPTVDELIEELSLVQIATLKGMEVMYSRNFMNNYQFPPQGTFKGQQIFDSEEKLKETIPTTPEDDEAAALGPFYKGRGTFRPGYLERRANVLTNFTPEIAVIEITTKNGNGWFKNRAPNTTTYRPLPVMRPQQFYSPKYGVKPVAEPDLRATIFWEPDITTNQNGKAHVSFYTSDVKSKYTVKVAGIDATGGIGDGSVKIN